MTFTVAWLQSAERELTSLWLETMDRAALATAANEIDRLLRMCPLNVGESREKSRRMLLFDPPWNGTEKVSGTFFVLLGATSWSHGAFEAKLPDGLVRPIFSTEGNASPNAATQCLEFRLGLRSIDVIYPARQAGQRPSRDFSCAVPYFQRCRLLHGSGSASHRNGTTRHPREAKRPNASDLA